MRIVFATHAYAPAVGGAERYAQGLAEAMASAGHDVHVLTPNRDTAEAFYEYGHAEAGAERELVNGVSVHRIPLDAPRSWKPGGARSFRPIPQARARAMWERYATRLEQRIDVLAPDATVALPHAFPNVSPALTARLRGVGVYAPLLHEEDPAWRVEPITDLVARSDVVIAMTTWERDRLIDVYGARSEGTCVAPPSVDAPDASSVIPFVSDTPYVLSVGRRTASKELLTTARAVSELHSSGIPVRFIVAGPCLDLDLDRELRSFAPSLQIAGEVSDHVKWRLIRGAVASVSMSAAESYGIATLEAWAMGRPPIARRVASVASVIDDGVDGVLVDDEEGLVAAITELLNDPEKASRIGAAGELKVLRTADSSASTIVAAIASVLP